MQTCPIPNCGLEIRLDHLMCSRHWWMVPKPLQAQVWTAWRTRQRITGLLGVGGADMEDHSTAVRVHERLKHQAVEAVTKRLARLTAKVETDPEFDPARGQVLR